MEESSLGFLTKGSESPSGMSNSLRPHGLNSSGQNTGVGSHSLLQDIFPTQGSNPGLLHCRWILYQLSHQGLRKEREYVALDQLEVGVGEGDGTPLQYSCLGNPMDGGTW